MAESVALVTNTQRAFVGRFGDLVRGKMENVDLHPPDENSSPPFTGITSN